MRAMGAELTGNNKFSDISESDWFYQDVLKAENAGVISGFPDGTFRPYGIITHEQAVKMLVNIYEKSYALDPSGDMATMYDDYYEISDWAKKNVSILRECMIINGVGGGRFAPKDNVTRAQAAKMIAGILDFNY